MSLGVGIIGASGIAGGYVHQLRRIGGVEVKGVHSRSQERADVFANAHGLAYATIDLDKFLKMDGIDAVVVATEPSRHLDIGEQAVQAGLHVLLEKPIGLDHPRAMAFKDLAVTRGSVVGVVSQKRYDPVLCAMKERLDAEPSGTPRSAVLSMMWHRDEAYYAHGDSWRRTGSPVFVNQGIHWIDVLLWFFGEAVSIQAKSISNRSFMSVADQTAAIITHADGTLTTLNGGTFCDCNHQDQFTIFSSLERLDWQEPKTLPSPSFLEKISRPKPSHTIDLMAMQVADFIDSIHQGRTMKTNADNGVAALRVALEISRLCE